MTCYICSTNKLEHDAQLYDNKQFCSVDCATEYVEFENDMEDIYTEEDVNRILGLK
jgi:hypothetical protein